jgi:chromosome segregation protein
VAVVDADTAAEALAALGADEGRAQVLVGAGTLPSDDASWPQLPAGAVYAIDVVTADAAVRDSLVCLLDRVAIVEDLAAARALVSEHPVVAVTRSGDVLSRTHAAGGRVESLIEVQGDIDESASELQVLDDQRAHAQSDVTQAGAIRNAARAAKERALAQLREVDAANAAAAAHHKGLAAAIRAAEEEVRRAVKALEAAHQASAGDQAAVADLQRRLAGAEAEPEAADPGDGNLRELKRVVEAARAHEIESKLTLRSLQERRAAVSRRVGDLRSSAADLRQTRTRLAAQRERLQRSAAVAADVTAALDIIEPQVEQALASAAAARAQAEQARTATDAELRSLREAIRELSSEAARLNDSVHRDEIVKAQQRLRIEAAEERALAEYGIDAPTLIAEYGPDQLIPPSAVPAGDAEDGPRDDDATPVAYVRAEQEARARKAERELAALGRVNPLALEEFAALQERQAFLTEQLEDLKRGREDLLGIISDVDERVREVFTEAYADVAVQFEAVFGRLFPGGEGRLVLTDPSDMLATGIEVEARPPGKRIKRLSLLSGGERSLTAVAFLVALFKARPSPFYLLDEVEAALDDVNLGRLLDLLEELRETSQLLVITHQKRSMEIADALYGITMRDGVTSVISQRLREAV